MCKMHGVRFIKGIKIFESMLQNNIYRSKTALCKLKLLIGAVIGNLGKCRLSLIVYFAK